MKIDLNEFDNLTGEDERARSVPMSKPAPSGGVLNFNLEVQELSVQAVCFSSPIQLPINYKFELRADIFEDIGIEPPAVRVIASEKIRGLKFKFKTKVNFIGLDEHEMGAIRKWILTHQPKLL